MISIVIPLFNEGAVIRFTLERLTGIIDASEEEFELIFVDDGSTDNTLEVLFEGRKSDNRIKVIELSRNFGHQAAITAGLDFASGDAVVVMDGDLQDPPELINALVEKWKEGYEIVYAVREQRQGESWFKSFSAWLFYRVLAKLSGVDIPPDTGDFRLIDRDALNVLNSMRETDRFIRGMVSWIGFRQIGVPFDRPERRAGETKFSLSKMIKFAASGIISFSDLPLRAVVWIGVLIMLFSAGYGVYSLIIWISGADLVAGWTSTILLVSMLGGINLVVTGMIGVYVGRIHLEVKKRPLYVCKSVIGFGRDQGAG